MKKRIEEMRKDLIEIFDEEYEKRRIITADFTAIKMSAKGYRKQSVGEWRLIQTKRFSDGSYYSKFFCSLCYREIGVCHEHEKDKHKNAKALYPYCHCGARMKGGE